MIRRSKAILFLAALFACSEAAPSLCRAGSAAGGSTPPASASPATYDVKVGGWVKGSGQSTTNGSAVSITATVEDESGNKGNLSASNLTVDDKSHFRGTGTVLGQSMSISGRIDAPSAAEKQLKTRRIAATFVTDDGHYGRVAGFMPPVDGSGSGSGSGGGSGGGGSGGGSGVGGGGSGGGSGGAGGGSGGGGGGGGSTGGSGNSGGNGNGQGNGGGNGQGNGNGNGQGNGGGNGQGNNGNGNGNGGGNGSNGGGNGKGNNGNGLGNGGPNGNKGSGGVIHRRPR